MNKKCLKCNIKKCKASCCAWVPFNIKFLEDHEDKIVRPVLAVAQDENNLNICKPITSVELREDNVNGKHGYIDERKQLCPFLTEDYRCNIYDIRPEICRAFGTKLIADHPFTCHYHIGRNYHFPEKGTKEFQLIDNIKYFPDIAKNKQLIREMFPETTDEDINRMIETSKQMLKKL